MRLVCPKCVAQYEVADGTIPDSGRDVQCANCNHIWFQDAAFKLSTDDLTHVPTKLHGTYDDDAEDEDDGEDAPGVFQSMRAAPASVDPDEAAERTLPEVGNNVLDILRSEAAFSSRRRAAARVGPDETRPEPQNDAPDVEDAAASINRRIGIGTRSGDIQPPPEPEEAKPETGLRATRDIAEEPVPSAPAADFRKLDWRHPAAADAPLHEEPEHDVTGLAADEAKRIAEAAVARSDQAEPAAKPKTRTPVSAEESAEHDREFRQALRRVSVRSLAEPDEDEDAAAPSPDLNRQMPKAPDLRADVHEDELVEDTVADELHAATVVADDVLPEDEADMAEFEAEEEYQEATYSRSDSETDFDETDLSEEDGDDDKADEEQEPEETEPALSAIDDPEDIRQVRRSLVENRKVLLPDVEELNTSLRMDSGEHDVDLRSSAFSEDDAANRSRFWLGLVTALMLFGILWALYLMGPAISDTFPSADPYVAAFRDMADSALDATARAWVPVVDWLESL